LKTLLVTGGIGSGKSAVCAYLQGKGFPVYDSDSRAKALYDSDRGLLEAVDSAFGGGLILPDGTLDRKALAARAFSSAGELSRLEALVHPAVLRDFISWRNALPGDCPLAVMESAIAGRLPEFLSEVDLVMLVDAPAQLRLSRACLRDGASREAILERMRRQETALPKADVVIVNDASLQELHERVDKAIEKIVYLQNNNSNSKMKTDLSRILSVSGYHGLYLYLAQARNGIIAESLSDKKRTAFDLKARITSLGDIAIFTSEGELKLKEVFLKLKEVLGDADAPSSKASADALKELFGKAVPDYDADRFYVSHMKKVVDWYNEVKNFASLDFVEGDEAEEAEGAEEAGEDPAND